MNEHGDYLFFAGIFGLLSVSLFIGLMDVVGDFPRFAAFYILPWLSMAVGGFVVNKKDRQR